MASVSGVRIFTPGILDRLGRDGERAGTDEERLLREVEDLAGGPLEHAVVPVVADAAVERGHQQGPGGQLEGQGLEDHAPRPVDGRVDHVGQPQGRGQVDRVLPGRRGYDRRDRDRFAAAFARARASVVAGRAGGRAGSAAAAAIAPRCRAARIVGRPRGTGRRGRRPPATSRTARSAAARGRRQAAVGPADRRRRPMAAVGRRPDRRPGAGGGCPPRISLSAPASPSISRGPCCMTQPVASGEEERDGEPPGPRATPAIARRSHGDAENA